MTVEVRWDDGANPYRIPEEVVLYLLADGMEEIRQTFRPANGKVKVAVFEGVPSYIKGKAVSGTVLETGAAAGGSAATHSAATHSAADGAAGTAGSATNVGTVPPCFILPDSLKYDKLLSDDFVNSRRGGEKDDYDQGNCRTA